MKRLAIYGVPRSGTSWLGEVVNSHPAVKYVYQPTDSQAVGSAIGVGLTEGAYDSWFEVLADTSNDMLLRKDQRDNQSYPSPNKMVDAEMIAFKEVRRFAMMYQLAQVGNCKLLCLVRDPIDVMTSWINSPNHWQDTLNVDEQLIHAPFFKSLDSASEYGMSGWASTALLYEQLASRFPDMVKIVRYEDIMVDMQRQVTDIMQFCNLQYSQEVFRFMVESTRRQHPSKYSVYRDILKPEKHEKQLSKAHVKAIVEVAKSAGLSKYLKVNQQES